MKITVFGANGRVGRQVVRAAAARGHQVRAFVRPAADVDDFESMATVLRGDVRADADAVTAAVDNMDAVIVTLGPRSPFERKLLTGAAATVVPAMERSGVKRLVVLSALGLSPAIRPAPFLLRLAATTFLRLIAEDKRSSEELIRGSDLTWTLVLPGPLTDRVTTPVEAGEKAHATGRVGRAPLAELLVSLAETTTSMPSAVTVRTRRSMSAATQADNAPN